MKTTWVRIVIGLMIVVVLIGTYWILKKIGAMVAICDCDTLHEYIIHFGVFGPLFVIVLMAGAIVLSPIPSAPIALAAGLAYGHTWGTIYTVIGAEIGALIAFTIGRMVGYEVLHKWFGDRLSLGLLGSQRTLMVIVFIGRMVPFISFDILSYAAGLTPLAYWRFALATLAGITPISFLLAHFGRELGSTEMYRITGTVLALGGITLIPVAVKWFLVRRGKRTASHKTDINKTEESGLHS